MDGNQQAGGGKYRPPPYGKAQPSLPAKSLAAMATSSRGMETDEEVGNLARGMALPARTRVVLASIPRTPPLGHGRPPGGAGEAGR